MYSWHKQTEIRARFLGLSMATVAVRGDIAAGLCNATAVGLQSPKLTRTVDRTN